MTSKINLYMESELVSGFMTEHAAVIFVFFFLAEYASILLICILTSILFLGGYLLDTTIVYNLIYYICLPLIYLVLAVEELVYIVIDFFVSIKSAYYTYMYSYDYASFYITGRSIGLTSWSEFVIHEYFFNLKTLLFTGISHKYLDNISMDQELLSNPLTEGIFYGLVLGTKSCVMIFIFIWARASFPRIRYDQLMSFCWTVLLPIVIAFIILFPCLLYEFSIIPVNIFLF